MRSRISSGSHLLPSVLQPGSLGVFEGSGEMVLHVEEDVRVGVEGRCLWCCGQGVTYTYLG